VKVAVGPAVTWKTKSSQRKAAGFTLLEMLITVVILGVLAMLAAPVAEVSMQHLKEQELRRSLREIRLAIDDYKRAYDQGRIQNSAGASGYPPSLQALVDGAEDLANPKRTKIFFLRRIPRDPLERSASVPNDQTWGLRSYSTEASSPAYESDVYDVFSKSKALALDGTPYASW
jgi:general secretion pathway protein G